MNAEPEKPDPFAQLRKPKTWNQVFDEYINERIDAGEEIENHRRGFNLNGKRRERLRDHKILAR